MTGAPPPNWYPDPHDEGQLRWWDGTQWTEHRHALVPASQPAAEATDQWASTPQPAADQWAPTTVPEQPAIGPEQPQAQPWEPSAETWVTETPASHTSWSPTPSPMMLPGPGAPPATNRRPMIIGAAVIAVLVIGVIAFAVTRGGDDAGDVVLQAPVTSVAPAATSSPATVATTTTTTTTTTRPAGTSVATTAPTATTLPGTTFTDPTNVYRLRVAPAWQDATTIGGLQTWSTGTSSSVFRDSVNVLIEKLPSDISMEDYLAASVRNAPKSLPSFVEISRSVSTVNGKVLGQLDFSSNQNIPLRHRAVVLIKGRNAIVVTYTTEPGRFDAEIPKVQPYLTSVEGI